MNSLKNVLIIVLLAVVACGVYFSMNNGPPTAPPPEVADGWSGQLQVELPGSGTEVSPFGAGTPTPIPPGGYPTATPTTPGGPPLDMGQNTAVPPGPSGNLGAPPGAGLGPTPGSVPDPTTQPLGGSNPMVPPTSAPPAGPGASIGNAAAGQVRQEFLDLLQTARQKLDAGNWREVHQVLTTWYGDPKLTAEESALLVELLDQIAGTAIFSRQHLMEAPHTVQPGETLQQIAESYNVPPLLLAKINGLRDPQSLRSDQQLKVLRGPFHAVVRLESHELTLMVDGRYAGRFPIGIGTDRQQLEGTYLVKEKEPNPTYYGPNGMTIGAEDPRNPLGKRWIGLGDAIGIHGTNDPQNIGRNQAAGSICLGERDIEDVFDILSVGSRVLIQR